MLATSYQQTPDADWTFSFFVFSDTYGLLARRIMRQYRTGRKLPGAKQRRYNMKETGKTAPKGDIQGSHEQALTDIQTNLKGGR